MIKVIAFDLVGVLVSEKDINMSFEEEKIERLFGPNINDSDYLKEARKIIEKDNVIIRTTESLIERLYEVKDDSLFKNLKEKYPYIKIIIATNHVSFIRNYIGEAFGVEYLDDIIISAEVHRVKPNKDFYGYILDKYNMKPSELLFLDDNVKNIDSASKLGINTIRVDKTTNILKEIENKID